MTVIIRHATITGPIDEPQWNEHHVVEGLADVAVSGSFGDLQDVPGSFPPSNHGHVIADVSGLQAALDGKQAASPVLAATTASFTTGLLDKLNGIAAGATANSPDAELRDRGTHTGTQSLDTTTDSATRLAMTAAERTKLEALPANPSALGAADTLSWNGDVFLRRRAANVLEQSNGTAAQTFILAATQADDANFERGAIIADALGLTLTHQSAGSGVKRPVRVLGQSLAGAEAVSALEIVQSWNTSGVPTALDLNITDTASNVSSLLMNLRVGGVSQFSVRKNGRVDLTSLNLGAGVFGGNGNWWSPNNLNLSSTTVLSFGAPDLILARDAANTLALRRGTNAQTLRVYNTFTDASNFERGFMRYASNVLEIGHEAGGTGNSGCDINFLTGGANRLTILGTGTIVVQNDLRVDGVAGLRVLSGPISAVGANSRIELAKVGAPPAPSANRVRIYAEDDGNGKTRLMVRFATGAPVQLAIEP